MKVLAPPAIRFCLRAVLVALILSGSAQAQQYWSGSGTWDATSANWTSVSGGPYTAAAWASGAAVFEGVAGTVTPSGALTANGLTFNVTGYSLATGTGASLTLSGIIATGANDASIATPLSGSGSITKTGLGMVTLSGSQAHTGGFAINGGTVRVSSFAFLQATGGSLFFNGGSLEFNGSNSSSMSTTRFTSITANAGGATFNISNALGVVDVQRTISGAGGITKTGLGTLTLSAAHTFSGPLAIAASGGTVNLTGTLTTTAGLSVATGGVFQLGGANRLPDSIPMVLAGGTFKTGSTTGFSETLGTLDLSGATTSTIALGSGVHTLAFAASSSLGWTGSTLNITGWSGTAGAPGTGVRIYFGNSAASLSGSQLAQISFTGFSSGASLLATGELVPAGSTGGGGTPPVGDTAVFQAPFADALGFGGTWLDGLDSGNVPRGASAQIRAGRQAADATSLARGLARWDVTSLEGKFTDITGLSLELTLAVPTTTVVTLQVYAVDQANSGWNESDSTKIRKLQSAAYPWTGASDAGGFPALSSGSAIGSVTLAAGLGAGTKVTIALSGSSAELVALVTDWIESRRSGLLFRLADESTANAAVAFHSSAAATFGSRPKLTVTYTAGHRVWTVSEASTYLSRYLSYNTRSFDSASNLVSQSGLLYSRYSSEYASCLLRTGRSEHIATAEAVIAAVLAQQFNNSADPLQHGYIRQYTTEPDGSYNGAMHDFALGAALDIRLNHYDQLSTTAKGNLNTLIQRATAWTNANRSPTNITNQETGAWYNLLVAGQVYNNTTWTARGTALFNDGGAQILANEGIHEFNSPTYTRISALHLRKLTWDLTNANIRDNCRRILRWVWAQTARQYHRPSRQWAGPMTRAYEETQFDTSTRFDEAYTALPEFQITAHGRDRVPAEYLAFFTDPLPAARQSVETFVKGPATPAPTDTVVNHWADHGVVPIIGTTYQHSAFSLGSLNFGHMGYNSSGTKRPLLLLWGDATSIGTSGFALLTMMKTGTGSLIETSRPILFSSQNNGDVLAGLTWSFNPNNDSPRSTSTSFSASELRIRFLSSGAAASSTFPAPASLNAATSRTTGGITTTLQCVYASFPGFTPTWVSSGGNLDLVIYLGVERTFDLATLARFTAAFALRTGPAGGVTAPVVSVTPSASAASLRVGTLSLLYPTQPDTIHVLARNYRDLLGVSELGAPASLAASPHAAGIDLYWNDLATTETGFTVQRRTGPGGIWTTVATLPADTTAFLDATAATNTEYTYRVRAFDAVNAGAWSAEVTTISLGAATPSPLSRTQPADTSAVIPVTFTNGASSSQTFTLLPPPNGANYTATTHPAGENSVYATAWDDTVPGTGTALSLGDDVYSTALNLNFNFPYHGRTMSRLTVCSNGFIVLGSASSFPNGVTPGGNAPYTNFPMPTFYAPGDIVALFWDDLLPDTDGRVYYKRVDTDGNGQPDTFIVHYENVRIYSKTTRFTAQIQIKDSGEFLFLYKDLPASLNSYTIGIQGPSPGAGILPPGVGVAYNTAYANSGMAVRFTPPVTWLSLSATSLTLAPGASGTVNFTLNTVGLANGITRNFDLPVTGSAAAQPAFTLPISLTSATAATPVFTTQPDSATVSVGGVVTFTISASGSPTPTLQWQRNNGVAGAWANISGATGATYTLTASAADTGAQFRCVATNSGGSSTSNSATLTVNGTYAAWATGINWNGADSSEGGDADGDGLKNLLEYALGGSPTNSASAPVPIVATSGNFLTLTFTPQVVNGLTYTVEASTNLSTWPDVTPLTNLIPGQIYIHTDSADLGTQPRRFLRLKVTSP